METALIVVNPETVVRGTDWDSRSIGESSPRPPSGWQKEDFKGVRDLIFRMAAGNPTWARRAIHGELLMLGFDVSERTISRWMKRVPRDPERAKRWLAFLRNHREAIAAMDFFTVPTVSSACSTASS